MKERRPGAAAPLDFERELWARGFVRVCGIDEAGRGPLAGPVVAAAVILPRAFSHPFLNDSKQLSAARREEAYRSLTENPEVAWSVARVEAEEVDRVNVLRATWQAMIAARAGLDPPPDWTLVDGRPVPPLGDACDALVRGDARSLSIAAASVIAKVARDRLMEEMDRKYPAYGFARHKGYGTAAHLRALAAWGPCLEHRKSFLKRIWSKSSGDGGSEGPDG
ncbi:MAG: ribonuclease HII [Verrucomicrobiae bacterium]|nr:ribonuclease HII [Verrucomicrobiae bacterium]